MVNKHDNDLVIVPTQMVAGPVLDGLGVRSQLNADDAQKLNKRRRSSVTAKQSIVSPSPGGTKIGVQTPIPKM